MRLFCSDYSHCHGHRSSSDAVTRRRCRHQLSQRTRLGQSMKNPYDENAAATQAGAAVRAQLPLVPRQDGKGARQRAVAGGRQTRDGDAGRVFWFITKGDKENGMPSWAKLPARQRWQMVTYVKSMESRPRREECERAAARYGRSEDEGSPRRRRSPTSATRNRARPTKLG